MFLQKGRQFVPETVFDLLIENLWKAWAYKMFF